MHLFYSLLHPIVRKAMSLGRKTPLLVEGKVPAEQPLIFVANHFCIHDIPAVGETIRRQAYVLVADEDRPTLDGFLLSLNGVVWINRRDRAGRSRAREKLLGHLAVGHSILVFPEATWNLTPNLPMLPMRYGVIDIANTAGVAIVPVTTRFTGDAWHVRIGERFVPTADKAASIGQLRDVMAASLYAQMEQAPRCLRSDILNGYSAEYIKSRYDLYARARKKQRSFRKYESQFIFRPRGVVDNAEAFAHLSGVPCNMRTAFLWNARLTGHWA